MGRFDTRFHAPPVRIGRAAAASAQRVMLRGASQTSRGAGGWGAREARYASVDMQLRIIGQGPPVDGALPLGRTQRKRGYPPITLPATTTGAG